MKKYLYLLLFVTFFGFSQEYYSNNNVEIEKKISKLDSLILENPSFQNYFNRGYLNHEIKNYEKALNDYNKAIQIDSISFLAYYNRACLKVDTNDLNGALFDYNKSINLGNNDYKIYFNRASLKERLNDINGAIEDYSRSLEIEPKNAQALHNRENIKKKQKLFNSAIIDYNEAIKINPFYIEAIQNRAICKASLGRKDAIDDFNRIIFLDNKNGEAYANRALYYIHNDTTSDYCFDLRKAIELGFNKAKEILDKHCIIKGK